MIERRLLDGRVWPVLDWDMSSSPTARPNAPNPSFREQSLTTIVEAFGAPEEIPLSAGKIYRWTLRRDGGVNVYVTLDSPEFPHIAHLLVADLAHAAGPIASLTMRTMEEVRDAVQRIRKQWKGEPLSP